MNAPAVFPVSDPGRIRRAIDWAALQAAAAMVGLPADHPIVKEHHLYRNAFALVFGWLAYLEAAGAIQLVFDRPWPHHLKAGYA